MYIDVSHPGDVVDRGSSPDFNYSFILLFGVVDFP